MKAEIRATNPAEIEMTMTITMSVGAWKLVRNDLRCANVPGSELGNTIRDLVGQAEKHFAPVKED